MRQLNRKINHVIEQDEKGTIPEAARKPNWHCYCCGDTGFVQVSLVKLIIPDYQYGIDASPICGRCAEGDKKFYSQEGHKTPGYENGDFDDRFDKDICNYLDAQNRQRWDEWQEQRLELVAKAQAMVNNFVNGYGEF